MVTSIGLIGAEGRMGRAIAALLEQEQNGGGVRLAGGVGRGGDIAGLARHSTVLIDFSSTEALPFNLEAATAARTPIVVGTTGLTERHQALLDRSARSVAVLQAANMSLGVTLLADLVREAAARLDADWDIELVEMHHRNKADAPSGTALMLGEAAAEGRGTRLEDVKESGRDGITGARGAGAIGLAALRGGSVAGDHLVIFAGQGERIELGHRAESRDIFARGAIRAALWLNGRAPGRYRMRDVLGLE